LVKKFFVTISVAAAGPIYIFRAYGAGCPHFWNYPASGNRSLAMDHKWYVNLFVLVVDGLVYTPFCPTEARWICGCANDVVNVDIFYAQHVSVPFATKNLRRDDNTNRTVFVL
jgi:hypothetical protein